MRLLAVKGKMLRRLPSEGEGEEVGEPIESSLLGFGSAQAGWGVCTKHVSKLRRRRGGVAEAFALLAA